MNTIRNAKRWCKFSQPACYPIAFGAFCAIFALRWGLHPLIGKIFPYQFFFIGSYIVTFFLGGGPGILVMFFGLVAGNYFFVEPYGEFTSPDLRDTLILGNYILTSMIVVVTLEYLQRVRYTNELLLRVAESRYEMFLHRENQRILLERSLKSRL
jgi:K+-sensing histidine kinase KdpD